jgi:hypothetical protein
MADTYLKAIAGNVLGYSRNSTVTRLHVRVYSFPIGEKKISCKRKSDDMWLAQDLASHGPHPD